MYFKIKIFICLNKTLTKRDYIFYLLLKYYLQIPSSKYVTSNGVQLTKTFGPGYFTRSGYFKCIYQSRVIEFSTYVFRNVLELYFDFDSLNLNN